MILCERNGEILFIMIGWNKNRVGRIQKKIGFEKNKFET